MADPALRIAYLTSQYPATSHTFIRREVEALRALGMHIETFSIRPPSTSELQDSLLKGEAAATFTVLTQPLTTFLAAHLGTIARRPIGYLTTLGRALSHRPPGLRALALSVAHFGEAIVVARELRRRKISRLHNHFANSAATVGMLAAELARIPWSFTMHGISETDYPAGLMLGRKIEAAEFVACVSCFGRAQAMRLVAPKQWHKLHVVRCGLEALGSRPHRPPRRVAGLLTVGRLSPEKGQAGLLQAFSEISGEHPDLELVLVGDGPESDRLRALALALGIEHRVRFTGRLSEADALHEIARADAFILPSFMEGLPVVLMEAMALGTPVIASRVAGIPELVEEGQSGLLFTPSDWRALTECIRRLVSEEGLSQALADKARAAVAGEFDIRRTAASMAALFSGNPQ